MQIVIALNASKSQSLQDQIFESIREQILSGRLKSGMSMPSTRMLSEQLSVSRNTIIFAYQRLITEGYLFSRKTAGTFVNPGLPDNSLMLLNYSSRNNNRKSKHKEKIINKNNLVVFKGRAQALFNPYHDQLDIDFWVGRPDPNSFPIKIWKQLTLKNLTYSGSKMTEYHDSAGIYGLRKAIADYLGPARGIKTSPEKIIITNGIQQALNLVTRLLIKNNSSAVVECPCYQGAAFVLESFGAKLYPVPVDEDGLDVTQLPKKAVSLAYTTPSHQYPMGSTLSLDRRIHFLDWANQNGAYIVEDDYDSDFRHHGSPLTAIAGQDQYDCVIYLGTFSKSIGAALRLGYVVVPESLIEPAKTAKSLMDNGHSWLDQMVLKDFIVSGSYLKHLRQIRRTYLKRRDRLISELHQNFGAVQLQGLNGGMHLVWRLPDSLPDAEEIQNIARKVGVGLYSLPAAAACDFGMNGYHERSVFFGYSSTTEAQIKDGISRLAMAIHQ